jgi:hypothetical protein
MTRTTAATTADCDTAAISIEIRIVEAAKDAAAAAAAAAASVLSFSSCTWALV